MLVKHLIKADRSTRYAVSASLVVIALLAMYSWLVAPHAAYLSVAQGYESAMTSLVNKNKVINNTLR